MTSAARGNPNSPHDAFRIAQSKWVEEQDEIERKETAEIEKTRGIRKKVSRWTRWIAPKNGNDGRRESAIKYVWSKWHAEIDGKTACGAIVRNHDQFSSDPLISHACKKCLRHIEPRLRIRK
ncbi:MAG: hypothetical protein PHT59_07560 [Candidatus Omnitrophica bacterium]|nr:hypothetical protein [Candidatus Omnitrophota bacterium]